MSRNVTFSATIQLTDVLREELGGAGEVGGRDGGEGGGRDGERAQEGARHHSRKGQVVVAGQGAAVVQDVVAGLGKGKEDRY